MKEIDCQSLVTRAVKEYGGHAHKLSNRFMIGVVDLLVKVPRSPAALFEVKLEKYRKHEPARSFVPDVTVLQYEFLHGYHSAGMPAGLISFVEIGGKGVRGLHMGVFMLDSNTTTGYHRGDHLCVGGHANIGNPANRAATILQLIKGALE